MKKLIVLILVLMCSAVWAIDEWVTTNQATVAWDIPESHAVDAQYGDISYRVYLADVDDVEKASLIFIGETVEASYVVTVDDPGRYVAGVMAVLTEGDVVLESDIAWSDNADDCDGGVTFGIQYIVPPAKVGGLRRG